MFSTITERKVYCCRNHQQNAKKKRHYSTEKRSAAHKRMMSCPLIKWVEDERKRAYLRSDAGHEAAKRYRLKLRSLDATHPSLVKARERQRVGWYKRQARKRSASGEHTTAQLVEQAERQRHKCYWCGGKLGTEPHTDYHPDHVVPLALGGSNDIGNIVAACPGCNVSKGAKHPIEFAGRLC